MSVKHKGRQNSRITPTEGTPLAETTPRMGYADIRHNNRNNKMEINRFQTINKKHTKLKLHIKFLLKCRKARIIPKFINNTTRCNNLFLDDNQPDIQKSLVRHIYLFHTKLLNLIIKHKHKTLDRHEEQLKETKTILENSMNTDDASAFFERGRNVLNKTTTKITERHEKKLERLRNKRNNNFLDNNKTKDWFVNKTTTKFPQDVQALLAKGPKFALPVDKRSFPLFNYIADGEELVQTHKNKESQETARTHFSLLVKEHKTKMRENERDRAIIDTVGRTRKFLNENKNILILNSDKGNKTVAIEKDEYRNKMLKLLGDFCTYRKLNSDPTSRLQKKNNELVDKLFRKELISRTERNKLITTIATPPRIYGLPKIHKEGTPLRPICSSIGSPSYALCKYIVAILKNLTTESKFNIKNAIEFKDKINDENINDDEILVSFDVVSLFPSIPLDLALSTIKSKWTQIQQHTEIPEQTFLEIVKFCIVENRYFKYEDTIFSQLKGMPMGSPASPVIADIVMEELLKNTLEKLKTKPRLLTKYVDDLFAITKSNETENILLELNSYHKNIKFTIEKEQNSKLPYLDSTINRVGGKLKLKWYKKPMASGRLINHNSKHPRTMIINTARGCIKRMFDISDKMYHNEIKREVTKILTDNDFPKFLIKKLIQKYQETPRDNKNRQLKLYKSLTYVPTLSERFMRSDCYNSAEVQIAHKPFHTLRHLYSNTKSKITALDKNNVIYKIPCSGNITETCDGVYVGTTKLKLKTRLAQHKSDFKLRHQFTTQKTALMTHCANKHHSPNFDATTILQQEQHYAKRYTLEMLHIINTPTQDRLNYKTDTENCAHIYRHLLGTRQQDQTCQINVCNLVLFSLVFSFMNIVFFHFVIL
jgi:hypothetical protein